MVRKSSGKTSGTKGAAKKKTAPKPAAKKPAKKKVPAKKAPAKKASKATRAKAVPKKPVKKKTVAPEVAAAAKPAAAKPASKPAPKKARAAKETPPSTTARKLPTPTEVPADAAAQFGLVAEATKKMPPIRIGKRDMAAVEKGLHAIRRQLAQDVEALTQNNLAHSGREMSGDLSGYGFHMADVATDNFAREMELNIATGETDRLRLVEEAIERLGEGEFGRCLECGQPVGIPRLKVIPYARFCIACAEETERG